MRQHKHITETITLGEGASEIRLTIESTEGCDDAPATVVIDGWEVTLQPEEIERVADALASRRHTRGDYRSVCADHGYYYTSADGCPTCPGTATANEVRA